MNVAHDTDASAGLTELLTAGEDERLAFVRERVRADELAETLAAFANRRGGTAILGVAGRVRPKVEGLGDIAATDELALEAALLLTPPLL